MLNESFYNICDISVTISGLERVFFDIKNNESCSTRIRNSVTLSVYFNKGNIKQAFEWRN